MPNSRLDRVTVSVASKWAAATFAVVAFGLFMPLVVLARPATHDEILDAMNAGLALTDAGFVCSEKKQTFGDCIKTTQTCSDTPWAAYVKTNYEVAGGLAMAKQGITKIGALAYLRADPANFEKAPGPVLKGTCYCECQGDETFEACKGKNPGTPFRAAEDLTYEQCAAKCQPRAIDQKCAGTLPPLAPVAAGASGPAPTASFAGDATCFKPAECGDQSGIFEAYEKCGSGKGRCYAAEPAIDLNVPIGNVKRVSGFNNYVIAAYRYLISVGAVAATVMFVYGAFLFLLGQAIPKINQGRRYMVDSVIGLLLILGATMILRTINPATTTLNPIKIFMINTIQFVNASYCSDLGDVKTALAGTKPAVKPYEDVAKDPKAFSIPAKQTECGKSYWVEKATGSSCEGSRCSSPGEACISCANGAATGCVGQASDARRCSKSLFGGTVNYINQRVPEAAYLLFICNNAQSTDPKVALANISQFEKISVKTIGRKAGGTTTETDEAGQAAYSFDFDAAKLTEGMGNCKDKGGFRGALLGVQYNDDKLKPEYMVAASALLLVPALAIQAGLSYDDLAIMGKAGCGGGIKPFDGYGDGELGADVSDLAKAFACGVKKSKLLYNPSNPVYWTAQELQDALNGKSISCDFNLSNENAPSDPGTRVCGEK